MDWLSASLSHHQGVLYQVEFVAYRAVFTQEDGEISMDPCLGIHEGVVGSENPNLTWLPTHPMA